MDNALQLIYYAWKKALQFLVNIRIDDAGNVRVFYVIVGCALFSILLNYLFAIPKTYHGKADKPVYNKGRKK